MKTSNKGVLFLMELEGVVLSRYRDSKGIWTIGVGHTKAAGGVDPSKVMRVLEFEEVMSIFREDLVKYEAAVSEAVRKSVTQPQFDALVSFHFNTGGIARASITRLINLGEFPAAGAAFLNWIKPPEIKGRRLAEYKLFTTGNYSEPFTVSVWKKNPGPATVVVMKES